MKREQVPRGAASAGRLWRSGEPSCSLVSIGLFSVVLAIPLAVLWEAAGPYDDPKAWALPILSMMIGLSWLWQTRAGARRAPTLPDARARLMRWVVLVCLLWTGIATVTSVAPLQSVFGSFGRGIGLLTISAVTLLFFVVQSECRTPHGARSLVDAALLGSVPVCLLALGQAAGWDPLPKVWDPAVASLTVRSTFGSHIFLGAYLAMLIPLTAARLEGAIASRAGSRRRPVTPPAQWWHVLAATAWVLGGVSLVGVVSHWSLLWWVLVPWGIVGAVVWAVRREPADEATDTTLTVCLLAALLAGQVLVVILTRGRGAFIAMLVGVSVVSFASLIRRRMWKTLVAAALALVAAAVLLALLNVPDSPVAALRRAPLLSRLGEIADVRRGSPGWVRLQVWRGIFDAWRRQIHGEEIFPGLSPQARSVIGYGPETHLLVLAPLTSPFLGVFQARTDTWRARYVIDRAHNSLLEHLVTEGLVGAGLYLVLAGTILVVGISRIRSSVSLSETLIRTGALGAVLAHLADGQVGIVTSMSLALFLLAAALLTSGPWLEPLGRSSAVSRSTTPSPRWWVFSFVGAACLAGLVTMVTTRWLLASVDYAEGTRHAIAGRMAAAHDHFRKSVALAPWLLAPAEAFASTALQLSGKEVDPSRRLVVLHEADAALARARSHSMAGATTWMLAAQLAFAETLAGERSRLAVSRDAYAEAVRRRPDDPTLLAQWAWTLFESGDAGGARRLAAQAAAREPRAWLAWVVLARSARELGDPVGAETAAAKARALAPSENRPLVDALLR